jgi:hypothetical protein
MRPRIFRAASLEMDRDRFWIVIPGRAVIPGRDEIANPESSNTLGPCGRIPGPACGRPGMTAW